MTIASSFLYAAVEISAHMAHPYRSLDRIKLWKREIRPLTGIAVFRKSGFFICSKAWRAAPKRAMISLSKSRFMANRTPRCLYDAATRTEMTCESVVVITSGASSLSNISERHWAAPSPLNITTSSVFPESRFIERPRALKAVWAAAMVYLMSVVSWWEETVARETAMSSIQAMGGTQVPSAAAPVQKSSVLHQSCL